MRLSQKKLVIVANPFAAPLSAEGACMALAAADPAEGGARYIGARTTAKPDLERRSLLSLNGKALGRDKVSVVYDLRPVTVADTSYHRNLIKAGCARLAGRREAPGGCARLPRGLRGGRRGSGVGVRGVASTGPLLDRRRARSARCHSPDGTPVTLSEGVVS